MNFVKDSFIHSFVLWNNLANLFYKWDGQLLQRTFPRISSYRYKSFIYAPGAQTYTYKYVLVVFKQISSLNKFSKKTDLNVEKPEDSEKFYNEKPSLSNVSNHWCQNLFFEDWIIVPYMHKPSILRTRNA